MGEDAAVATLTAIPAAADSTPDTSVVYVFVNVEGLLVIDLTPDDQAQAALAAVRARVQPRDVSLPLPYRDDVQRRRVPGLRRGRGEAK